MSTPIVKYLPLGDRVLLRPIEQKTRGGLHLTEPSDQADEQPTQYCEIIAAPAGCSVVRTVADGRLNLPPLLESTPLSVGARVYVARYKSSKVEIDGEELFVCAVEDLLLLEQPISTAEEATAK